MASVVTADTNLDLSTHQPIETPATGVLVTSAKAYRVTVVQSLPELHKIRRTLKEWVEVMAERLGHSRAEKYTKPKNFEEDAEKFEDFRKVRGFIDLGMGKRTRELESANLSVKANVEDASLDPCVIAFVEDQDGVIQAISSSSIGESEVYVNAILTAPWNQRMHGPVDKDQQCLVTKGAGTRLMAFNYQLAQTHEKPILKLKPLDGSLGFYERIGMVEKDRYCVYLITKQVPVALKGYLPKPELTEEKDGTY